MDVGMSLTKAYDWPMEKSNFKIRVAFEPTY